MRIFTIIVCGGRNYRNKASVDTVLDGLYDTHGPVRLVQGGATGADQLARDWSHRQTYKLHSMINVPADWKTLGRKAGPIRNQKMLDEYPIDLVIAFPGGRGTEDMIERSEKAGVEVVEIRQ